mmetsp:Transcript_41966/g.100004  ORF Transcript_41966/g.100004 Transcript_41966/m.100004 type:complete len:325 (-) Transcript_41966:20-994(-)
MVHDAVPLAVVEDSTSVHVPVGRVHRDGHGAHICQCFHQGLQLVCLQPHVAMELHIWRRLLGRSFAVLATIDVARVVLGVVQAMPRGILEGELGGGALTSAVSAAMLWIWSAVHQLLEGHISWDLAGVLLLLLHGDLRVDLQCAGGRHGPAGAAGALLLHVVGADQVLAPIHGGGQVLAFSPHDAGLLQGPHRGSFPPLPQSPVAQQCLELRVAVVCKHVHSCRPGNTVPGIVLVHKGLALAVELKALTIAQGILSLVLAVLRAKVLVVLSVDVFLGQLHLPISGHGDVDSQDADGTCCIRGDRRGKARHDLQTNGGQTESGTS